MLTTCFSPENIPFIAQLPGDNARKADVFSMGTLFFMLLVSMFATKVHPGYVFLLLDCSSIDNPAFLLADSRANVQMP